MATVIELTAPYENYLVPVRPDGPGVCLICATGIQTDFKICHKCNQAKKILNQRADIVSPIALAVWNEQLAYELSAYKNSAQDEVKSELRLRLAALLWRWLSNHEKCLARQAGVSSFKIVTTVPSTSSRSDEPLAKIVGGIVGITKDRYRSLLQSNRDKSSSRDFESDKYIAPAQLEGEAVLLIDDTWTSGGHAQSASFALKQAGAGSVGVVVIGRRLDTGQQDHFGDVARDYLRLARAQGWDWTKCRFCM